MNVIFRKTLAVLLVLSSLIGCMTIAFTAAAEDAIRTTCGGDCPYAPSIVIPGVFQSQNRLYDDDGNVVLDADGKPLHQLFINVTKKDIVRFVLKGILPVTLSLALQADVGLSKTVASIVAEVFANNAKNNEGEHIKHVDVIRYPDSVACCTQEGKDFIYGCIPLEDYSRIAGEDHLYFFTYESFDSVSALADELFAFIQKVKRETGHDKINLVPISQGASIANDLMARYRDELARDLDRLVFIVPALDGSSILGNIFSRGFVKENDTLYRDLFPTLMKDDDQKALGYGLNLALRLLPKKTVYRVIDRTVEALADTILVNSTCMWALTPQSEYNVLYERYLADGSREKLRAELEFFHDAQVHSPDNILYLQSKGVEVFDLVNYDYPLYPLFDGWRSLNADGVIQLDSTSSGATSCPINETLPDSYVQKNTYCTCGGNHISPDRKVDASTGTLCETTFYFDEGNHEKTGQNDVIISLAVELLTNKDFKDVHSYPDRYPQFNTARHSRGMRSEIVSAESVDKTKLDAADAAELQGAINEAKAVLAETIVDLEKFNHARDRLHSILVKLGLRNADQPLSEKQKRSTDLLERLSDWAFRKLGARGYSDVVFFRH